MSTPTKPRQPRSGRRTSTTLKVEAVYLAAHEMFEDVIADLPHLIDEVYPSRRLQAARGRHGRRRA